jgi:hypothetical protein
MSVTLEQARLAKRLLTEMLGGERYVNGIGIVRSNGDYGLKVNLLREAPALEVPDEIEGVSVMLDVTGPAYPG